MAITESFFEAYRGLDFKTEITLTEDDCVTPLDITGCEITFKVSDVYGTTSPYLATTTGGEVVITDAVNGVFEICFDSSNITSVCNNVTILVTFPDGTNQIYFRGWSLYLLDL